MQAWRLGRIGALELKVQPSVVAGSLLLWAVLALLGRFWLQFSLPQALGGAGLGVALHWLAVSVHQTGHALAARYTGHTMRGVRLYFLLAMSRYPANEGPLPARIHIQRALGGPILNLALAAVAYPLSRLTPPGSLSTALIQFLLLDSLLVFTIGSLTPLPFMETDGSTILKWSKKSA